MSTNSDERFRAMLQREVDPQGDAWPPLREVFEMILATPDLAELAGQLPAFYERTRFGRPAAGVSMYVNGVEIDPIEAQLAVRVASAAPDIALEIVRQAVVRGGERFRGSGAAPWMRDGSLAAPAEAESHRIAAEIEVAFDLAKLGLGWARAIGAAQPGLRARLVAALREGEVLRGCLGWLDIVSGNRALGISGYFEDQAMAIRSDWNEIVDGLA